MIDKSYTLTRTHSGDPVARFVNVYLRPITDEQKLRLAKERFSRKGFESDEVVPGALWEVATNCWASYNGEGFDFYEPLPTPVAVRSGVLVQED